VLPPSHFFISQIPRWHHTANRCGSNVIPHEFVYAERKFELLLFRDPLHVSFILPSSDSLSIYGEHRVSTLDFHFTEIYNSKLCLSCDRSFHSYHEFRSAPMSVGNVVGSSFRY
jgi:hypothetical protein